MVGEPKKLSYKEFGVETSLGFMSLNALGALGCAGWRAQKHRTRRRLRLNDASCVRLRPERAAWQEASRGMKSFDLTYAEIGKNSGSGYCMSYTAVLLNFFPLASVPVEVTVRLLPSSDTTILPEVVTVVPFFTTKSNS